LKEHAGKCRRLHGHTYKVDITVLGPVAETPGVSGHGMVVDFDVLKEIWEPIGEWLDHRTMLDFGDPLYALLIEEIPESIVGIDGPPTAERIADVIHEALAEALNERVKGKGEPWDFWGVDSVRVWETPTSYAETNP
jgi:6-pyruvoyltetrahydropterin/6-carboxytetrahydropterin synthase